MARTPFAAAVVVTAAVLAVVIGSATAAAAATSAPTNRGWSTGIAPEGEPPGDVPAGD